MKRRTYDDAAVKAALSELEDRRAAGQRAEPPRFHPFPARMPVSIAEHLIERLTTTTAVILDPMVGSGTTLVAARRLGRYSVGFDRDPLAVLISRTAIASLNSQRLQVIGTRILEEAKCAVQYDALRLLQVGLQMSPEDRAFLDYWFLPEAQQQLCALAEAVEKEPDGVEKDFAWVVFSSLIIAKSAGASLALDLARSRPHRRSDKPVVLPFDGWNRRFQTALARLPFKDWGPLPSACVQNGDARCLPVADRTVDLVVTSPPYLSAIDYLRTHKFSLVWMGYRLEQLRELRGTMVGTERGLWSPDGLAPVLEERLSRHLADDRERAQRRRYLSDLTRVLGETERVLRTGGLAVMAIGPTMISSKRSDAAEIVATIAGRMGLHLVAAAQRYLPSAHRSLPPPSAATRSSPLGLRMRREVIVALRK